MHDDRGTADGQACAVRRQPTEGRPFLKRRSFIERTLATAAAAALPRRARAELSTSGNATPFTRFILGVNYWPRTTATRMWRDFRPREIAAELREVRELGIGALRAFLFLPDFVPTPDRVEPIFLDRFRAFLDLCQSAGVQVFPTPLVGHMSGENWDLPWRNGRDFFKDDSFVTPLADRIHDIAHAVRAHPAIAGWILTNEVPQYVGWTDNVSGLRWADRMLDAVRRGDPGRVVGLGDGAWNLTGQPNGLPVAGLASRLDFFGPHTYPSDTDALRLSYWPSFLVRAMRAFGRPVLFEEFGCSSTHVSDAHAADYYRTTLHSTFIAGANGIMPWCFSDFALDGQRPYAHHPHELLFGITRADGSVKPAGEEVRRFARLIQHRDGRCLSPRADACIVLPSYLHTDYRQRNAPEDVYRPMLEAMILARQARLDVAFWAEPTLGNDGVDRGEVYAPPALPADPKVMFVPSGLALTSPTWDALERWVAAGGTLYVSFRQKMWIQNFERLFGCRQEMRYGLPLVPAGPIEWRWKESLGGIAAGETWSYAVQGERSSTALCPVVPTTASVLAVDGEGRPAVLRNRSGQGQTIFVTYPLEHYLANTPDVHETDTSYRLYAAIADAAGLRPEVRTKAPEFEITVTREASETWVWIVNHAWHEVRARLDIRDAPSRFTDVESGQPVSQELDLAAKQVRVLQWRRSEGA